MTRLTYRRKYGVHCFGRRPVLLSRLAKLLIGTALLQAWGMPAWAQVVGSGTTLDVTTATNSAGITGVLIEAGGTMDVFSTMTAAGTTISGGTLNLEPGSFGNGTAVYAGGTLNVSSGADAGTNFVSSGGTVNVLLGGSANSTPVSSGGELNVAAGGSATAVTQNSGAA